MKCKACSVILKDHEITECDFCKKSFWRNHIKTKCIICQYPLIRSEKRYISQGNFCRTCAGSAQYYAQYGIHHHNYIDRFRRKE